MAKSTFHMNPAVPDLRQKSDYLLYDDNTIRHLPPRDESRLKGADEGPQKPSKAVGEHLVNDQINAVGQGDGLEVTHPLSSRCLGQQHNVSPIDTTHPASTSMKLLHKRHDVWPHLGPAVFVEENRDPITP